MAIPNYKLCDICGSKCFTKTLFVFISRDYNGVENVDNGRHVDLCPDHLSAALQMIFNNRPNVVSSVQIANISDLNTKFLDWVDMVKSK